MTTNLNISFSEKRNFVICARQFANDYINVLGYFMLIRSFWYVFFR